MRLRTAAVTTPLALCLAAAALAYAPAARAEAAARRPVPDYDGRPEPAPSAGEVLLAVPRVALLPLYAVAEYGLRAPARFTVQSVERTRILQYLWGLTHPIQNVTVFPTLVVDFGLLTSVGVYVGWTRALAPQNALHLRAATGGPGFWLLSLTDRVTFAPRSALGVRGSYLERSDWYFYGLGPTADEANAVTFNWGRTDVRAFAELGAWPHGRLDFTAGLRADRFGDPRIPRSGQHAAPPGYENNTAYYGEVRGFLDSRPLSRPNTTGARIDAMARHNLDVQRGPARRWINYEVEGAVFLEIMRPGRVLSLRAYAGFADPLGREPVPLVDLVTLGGFESMRGWFVGRFRGDSAAVFTLNYRYPVGPWVDGNIYLEAGNAFGPHLAGFAVQRLHGSAGIGFRTNNSRDMSFDVLLAVGTSRFDEPFAIDAARFAVGLNRGF